MKKNEKNDNLPIKLISCHIDYNCKTMMGPTMLQGATHAPLDHHFIFKIFFKFF
jgi:hypothetical protein